MARDFVKPRILRGFQDFPPQKQILRQRILDRIREVYESFGFMPLDTPCIEERGVLLGKYGDESTMEIFLFDDPDGTPAGLRYEFTVPLARYMALNPHTPRPFKRYQTGIIWRAEKPRPGRFREFLQTDVDICGTTNMQADAEIVAVIDAALSAVGLEGYLIRISSRKLLMALAKKVEGDVPAIFNEQLFRVLDKLEKHPRVRCLHGMRAGEGDNEIASSLGAMDPHTHLSMARERVEEIGFDEALREAYREAIVETAKTQVGFFKRKEARKAGLLEKARYFFPSNEDYLEIVKMIAEKGWDESAEMLKERHAETGTDDGAKYVAVPFEPSESTVEALTDYLMISGSNEEVLRGLKAFFGEQPEGVEALGELEKMLTHLGQMAVPKERWALDPTLARGLAYYTGPVFEAVLKEIPGWGSILGGGRYDDLVGQFGRERIPATGASIGVDRILAALERLGLIKGESITTQVLVTTMDRSLLEYCFKAASILREAGIRTEVFCGDTGKLTKQLEYADKIGVPLALVIGADEYAKGEVALKDLKAPEDSPEKQVKVRLEGLADFTGMMLAGESVGGTVDLLRKLIVDPNIMRGSLSGVKGCLGELLVKQKLESEGRSVHHKGHKSGNILQTGEMRIYVKYSVLRDEPSRRSKYWGWSFSHRSKHRSLSWTHAVCVAFDNDYEVFRYLVLPRDRLDDLPEGSGPFSYYERMLVLGKGRIPSKYEPLHGMNRKSRECMLRGAVLEVKPDERLTAALEKLT